MEAVITIHIEKLPEGVYLSTSDMLQGLVAQGRTIRETLDIARDVAKMLLEAGQEPQKELFLPRNRLLTVHHRVISFMTQTHLGATRIGG